MNILPDSRAKQAKGVKRHVSWLGPLNWQPIFCANCGADGGYVPEENRNFAFYLCQPCCDKLPPIEGTYVTPDEVFWKEVQGAQLEKYGRLLNPDEIAVELSDSSSVISKLQKERK
jgi:hypothetical protein